MDGEWLAIGIAIFGPLVMLIIGYWNRQTAKERHFRDELARQERDAAKAEYEQKLYDQLLADKAPAKPPEEPSSEPTSESQNSEFDFIGCLVSIVVVVAIAYGGYLIFGYFNKMNTYHRLNSFEDVQNYLVGATLSTTSDDIPSGVDRYRLSSTSHLQVVNPEGRSSDGRWKWQSYDDTLCLCVNGSPDDCRSVFINSLGCTVLFKDENYKMVFRVSEEE